MNPWIATSNQLPQEGQPLLFVVEQRDIVLCGTYSSCMFKSRWSCYSPADVTEWRLLDVCMTGHDQRQDACSQNVQAATRAA